MLVNKRDRLLTAVVMPFDAQGEVNCQQAKRLAVSFTGFRRCGGVVISGTTGKSSTLS